MATQVVIGANIKKTSDRIDPQGNIVHPKTKEVIQPNVPVYIPTPEEIDRSMKVQATKVTPEEPLTPTGQAKPALNILEQIKQAEEHLKALKAMKKEQIELVKKQLAELEK